MHDGDRKWISETQEMFFKVLCNCKEYMMTDLCVIMWMNDADDEEDDFISSGSKFLATFY